MAQPPGGDFYMTTIEMQLFLKSYLIWNIMIMILVNRLCTFIVFLATII